MPGAQLSLLNNLQPRTDAIVTPGLGLPFSNMFQTTAQPIMAQQGYNGVTAAAAVGGLTGSPNLLPHAWRALGNARDNAPCNTLFIGNLGESTREDELHQLMASQNGFRWVQDSIRFKKVTATLQPPLKGCPRTDMRGSLSAAQSLGEAATRSTMHVCVCMSPLSFWLRHTSSLVHHACLLHSLTPTGSSSGHPQARASLPLWSLTTWHQPPTCMAHCRSEREVRREGGSALPASVVMLCLQRSTCKNVLLMSKYHLNHCTTNSLACLSDCLPVTL